MSCAEQEFQDSTFIHTATINDSNIESNSSRNLYFGDLHVHTGWSFDAYTSNVRVTPDQAYQFGKGQAIPHVSGGQMKMNRPLDFMAVADHAEYMGALMQMTDESHSLSKFKLADNLKSSDPNVVRKAFRKLQFSMGTNWPYKELIKPKDLEHTWEKMVEIADQHYEPGTFTTFPAYEWTSSPAVYRSLIAGPRYAQNLHRNVIYKGGKVSGRPFSSFDSQNPELLWEWMEKQRDQGIELIAIPHNANISDGRMYALNTYDGSPFDSLYIETRLRNEPVNEVVQIKGQSMTHPILSPNDEFADFEVYPFALGQGNPRKEVGPSGAYVREAWKNGMVLEQTFGNNPFQFGVIGSSDGHNGGSNVEENNNIGKSGIKDLNAEVRLSTGKGGLRNRKSSVAGLAAVWAGQNTRESIFDALVRKEVYATSGPRIQLRFFGFLNWTSLDLNDDSWVEEAYKLGVPMGSTLHNVNEQNSLSFIIKATKDNEGANLDQVQIIKVWVDNEGNAQEKIYPVVWDGYRKLDNHGRLPLIENTVDTTSASYTNTIGSVQLSSIWQDSDFDPTKQAFYYARVLEIPTPRWTTFDAVSLGVPMPKDVPYSIQERAWSSPIWYKPE